MVVAAAAPDRSERQHYISISLEENVNNVQICNNIRIGHDDNCRNVILRIAVLYASRGSTRASDRQFHC
jgi:hypothetical protein